MKPQLLQDVGAEEGNRGRGFLAQRLWLAVLLALFCRAAVRRGGCLGRRVWLTGARRVGQESASARCVPQRAACGG
eukprot:10369181-Prorocentrum_lima.AAC.1